MRVNCIEMKKKYIEIGASIWCNALTSIDCILQKCASSAIRLGTYNRTTQPLWLFKTSTTASINEMSELISEMYQES